MNFDDEARKLFAKLGLNKLGAGHAAGGKYNALDPLVVTEKNKATVYVGNENAARSRQLLDAVKVTHVVNCTENIPNYHERVAAPLTYLRFPISYWAQHVTKEHASVLRFLQPLFEFVEDALEQGGSVLIHCLAGAHRAGTAGCLMLMHFEGLGKEAAVQRARLLRPAINPIGMLPMLLQRYEAALQWQAQQAPAAAQAMGKNSAAR